MDTLTQDQIEILTIIRDESLRYPDFLPTLDVEEHADFLSACGQMNPMQLRTVRQLIRLGWDDGSARVDNYQRHEIKHLSLEQRPSSSRSWEFRMTVGLKNDEGTMAAALCRSTAQVFIYERGGIRWFERKNGETISRKGWNRRFWIFHS